MTDEEREKLCKRLRSEWSTVGEQVKAADEIERLAARVKSLETAAELNLQEGERLAAENDEIKHLAALAQSDAEPVAWLLLNREGERIGVDFLKPIVDYHEKHGVTTKPLFTAPPRPDASGLKEKADLFDSAVEAGRNAGWDMGIYTPRSLIQTLNAELVRLHAIVERNGVRPDASAGLIEAAAKKQYELDSENSEAVPTWEYIRPVYILHAEEVLKAAFAAGRSAK